MTEEARRTRLPKRRTGFMQEANVGGHTVLIQVGEYEDGRAGEIFIDMHKQGSAFRSMMACFAISISIGLQHGIPLSTYVKTFIGTTFEPNGACSGHDHVREATSIVDFIFRVLGVEYLKRVDLAQAPKDDWRGAA